MSDSSEMYVTPDQRRPVDASAAANRNLVEQVKYLKIQGNNEFFRGNDDGAITFYTEALSMCPESEKELLAILYQNRAAAHSKLNNNENCVADCDKALELVPAFIKALFRRARALTELGNLKLAVEDMTAVLMLDGLKNGPVKIFADTVMKRLGEKNLEEYTKKIFVFNLPAKTIINCYMKSFSDDPYNDEFSQTLLKSDVNTGLEFALKCIRDKQYEGIEEACKEELNKADNSLIRKTLTLNLLATFFLLCAKYAAGIEHFTTVIETPGVPKKLLINSLIKRASIYHKQHQDEKSNEDFENLEDIEPDNSEIYHHKALIYGLELNYEKAIEEYKKAIELNPNFVLSNIECCYAQYLHANQMSNELDVEKYSRKLKEFIFKYPDHTESYTLNAAVLLDNGAYEEADLLYKKANEIYRDDVTFLLNRAHVVIARKTGINEAFEFLEQALQIDPKCCEAYKMLGLLYFTTGQLNEAIKCYEEAIPLVGLEKELLHIFSLRDSARAQLGVVERLGLAPQPMILFKSPTPQI